MRWCGLVPCHVIVVEAPRRSGVPCGLVSASKKHGRGVPPNRPSPPCPKMEIPELLAEGPRTAAAVAAAVGREASIIERLLYACAANGVFQLGPAAVGG